MEPDYTGPRLNPETAQSHSNAVFSLWLWLQQFCISRHEHKIVRPTLLSMGLITWLNHRLEALINTNKTSKENKKLGKVMLICDHPFLSFPLTFRCIGFGFFTSVITGFVSLLIPEIRFVICAWSKQWRYKQFYF